MDHPRISDEWLMVSGSDARTESPPSKREAASGVQNAEMTASGSGLGVAFYGPSRRSPFAAPRPPSAGQEDDDDDYDDLFDAPYLHFDPARLPSGQTTGRRSQTSRQATSRVATSPETPILPAARVTPRIAASWPSSGGFPTLTMQAVAVLPSDWQLYPLLAPPEGAGSACASSAVSSTPCSPRDSLSASASSSDGDTCLASSSSGALRDSSTSSDGTACGD